MIKPSSSRCCAGGRRVRSTTSSLPIGPHSYRPAAACPSSTFSPIALLRSGDGGRDVGGVCDAADGPRHERGRCGGHRHRRTHDVQPARYLRGRRHRAAERNLLRCDPTSEVLAPRREVVRLRAAVSTCPSDASALGVLSSVAFRRHLRAVRGGEFSTTLGATACTRCPPNTASPAAHGYDCFECPRGPSARVRRARSPAWWRIGGRPGCWIGRWRQIGPTRPRRGNGSAPCVAARPTACRRRAVSARRRRLCRWQAPFVAACREDHAGATCGRCAPGYYKTLSLAGGSCSACPAERGVDRRRRRGRRLQCDDRKWDGVGGGERRGRVGDLSAVCG